MSNFTYANDETKPERTPEDIKKDEAKALKEKLMLSQKSVWERADDAEIAKISEYAVGYAKYLDAAKTEREAVTASIALAKAHGFVEYKLGDKIVKGGRYYHNNRGHMLTLFTVGTAPLTEGFRIGASHIDSPRIDLKPIPLYEDSGIAFFRTHYYGGIKKYQWTTIPLSIHGVLIKADGSTVTVNVGEDESDPIFYISDLLPHLAKNQVNQPLGSAIDAGKLNVWLGTQPLDGAQDGKIKLNVMKFLNEKYGIIEADFISAELTIVPAMKARDVGFDRSLIAGYGHDDRVCSYPALTGMFDSIDSKGATKQSLMVILADKEETGSGGATGMKTALFTDIIDEAAKAMNVDPVIVRANSKCLSADVNAAYDPNYSDVYERSNSCFLNNGVVVTKYTGSGGKGGTSDATAEFMGYIRNLFDKEGVVWQIGELGKVDQGGGGTVAVYIAEHNIETVDLGVPVISMHAPYEVIAKTDLYQTHKAFLAFNK